ncbi:YciI family protein [Novosphingobium panipatense]|uniref:hypothetical protein n=1 Tax=Novosphingobium panipatense TaxID=428991 RepID=UPI0036198C73
MAHCVTHISNTRGEPANVARCFWRGYRKSAGHGDAALRRAGARGGGGLAVADPYVKEGLVERWNVRRWMTVAGEGAASPLRPGVEGL